VSVHNGTTHENSTHIEFALSGFDTVSVGKGIAYDWLSLVVASSSDFDAELAALIAFEGAN
jgi:hypothetical protein